MKTLSAWVVLFLVSFSAQAASELSSYSSFDSDPVPGPKTICQKPRLRVLIEPDKMTALFSDRATLSIRLRILEMKTEILESLPPIFQTTYTFELGYQLVVSIKEGEKKGTASLYHGAEKLTELDCHYFEQP